MGGKSNHPGITCVPHIFEELAVPHNTHPMGNYTADDDANDGNRLRVNNYSCAVQ